jgi:hypothetical protein
VVLSVVGVVFFPCDRKSAVDYSGVETTFFFPYLGIHQHRRVMTCPDYGV